MSKTFREVIEANGGKPVEFKVAVPAKGERRIDEEGGPCVTDGDGYLTASCWTDDDEMLDLPASFDVDASWQHDGGIGRYDNLHGELDSALRALSNKIAAKFGGDWCYDAADSAFYQA